MQMVFDFLERAEMTFHSNQCGIILFYVSAIVAHLADWHMMLYERLTIYCDAHKLLMKFCLMTVVVRRGTFLGADKNVPKAEAAETERLQ